MEYVVLVAVLIGAIALAAWAWLPGRPGSTQSIEDRADRARARHHGGPGGLYGGG